VYLLAARAAVREGDAAGGFLLAEQAKSRALLDLMAVSREPVPGAELPALRQWREQGMQLQLTRGLLAQARSQRSADPARVAMLEQQLRDVELAHREAERAVASVYPRFQQAVSTTAPVLDANGVRRLLPSGTLLLEYFFVGEELLIWAISADAAPVAHHATFDTSAITRDIRALHSAIDGFAPWQPIAERLAAQLLVPFAAQIAACRDVLIVPHGAAHLLPFHLLPVNGAMLADRQSVSYLPSASALQWLSPRAMDPVAGQILVVGNPTLDLPAATREAQCVAQQFPGATLLLEGDATEAAVRRAIPGMPLVHFATHGVLDEAMPLNSCLLLADGDELTVYELMLLRLQARLVVLSACSTGKGETTGGDDVLGLTRALLAAGAEAAVVSLWPVDDHSTALFMQEFYAGLSRGLAPRHALQAAQVALRSLTMAEIEVRTRGQRRSPAAAAAVIPDDEGGYRHPYFWAPFILVGR
jgi:CHAT domain-containing protein